MQPIVIIGAGMAAYSLARELRKLDKTSRLTIVTADSGGAYAKPMLSNAFALNKQASQLVSASAEQMATQLDASIVAGARRGRRTGGPGGADRGRAPGGPAPPPPRPAPPAPAAPPTDNKQPIF